MTSSVETWRPQASTSTICLWSIQAHRRRSGSRFLRVRQPGPTMATLRLEENCTYTEDPTVVSTDIATRMSFAASVHSESSPSSWSSWPRFRIALAAWHGD